jgi:hypothetical protein
LLIVDRSPDRKLQRLQLNGFSPKKKKIIQKYVRERFLEFTCVRIFMRFQTVLKPERFVTNFTLKLLDVFMLNLKHNKNYQQAHNEEL